MKLDKNVRRVLIANMAMASALLGGPSPAQPLKATTTNCTYTIGYWKTHSEAWPIRSLQLGGVVYTQAQLTTILNTAPKNDATYLVAHSLLATKLNVAYGANGASVAATITSADNWLKTIKLGSNPAGSSRSQGTSLANKLEQFNNGAIGPGHCDRR